MIEFNDVINAIKTWVKIYKSYKNTKGVCLIRYEDLMKEPVFELDRVCRYLKVEISN